MSLFPVSRKRLNGLRQNLVCGLGTTSYMFFQALQVEHLAREHVCTPFPYRSSRWTLCCESRFVFRHELTRRFTKVMGGENVYASARAALHPLKQNYSLPLVDRPKGVLPVV